ncbi:MAG: pitrilysin family protein [Betaproteobacteria bacterium]|nr:pitrilysin family protein [Betaproteobacteria bacterium]
MMRTGMILGLLLWSGAAVAALPIQHWQLDNGAQVYFVENHDLPIIDVSVDFPAGSAYDPVGKEGVASLTRRLLDQGAGGLTDVQIAGQLADVGATLGGHFDADRAGVTLRTLSRPDEAHQALSLMTAVIDKPAFAASVVEREKARVIDALRQSDGEPQVIAAVAFQKAVFAGHPYAHRETGEIATVSPLASTDLQAFYRSHYTAGNAVISLVGDMTRAQADAIAHQLTAGLVPGKGDVPPLPSVPALTDAQVRNIPFPSHQSQIFMGQPGVARGDPDYYALYVGNYVLGGGGFDSRLMNDVRQKRGLAYSVYSYFIPMRVGGVFQIGLQTRADQTGQALQVVRQTVDDFMAQGVTPAELTQAKNSIVGGFPLRIDSNAKLLDYVAMIGFYGLPLDYLDTFPTQVQTVTANQIAEAFRRHLNAGKMVTVVVGAATAAK